MKVTNTTVTILNPATEVVVRKVQATSALFVFATSKLRASGNTVGYFIFNTALGATAIVCGVIKAEWIRVSPKARKLLNMGLEYMIISIVISAYGNV